jgi:hypothetical protein
MANSNRVFVSPGVYTSEKDLTFVAQSVGVTTLGLVGETLKGPAFEPILVGDFDEFKTYFGPTSPAKFGDGNPKYELPYVAKSYLQESNQLFVTRVLGLTGYKPNKTFAIQSIGGVILQGDEPLLGYEVSAITITTTGITTADVTIGSDDSLNEMLSHLSGVTSIDGTNVMEYLETTYGGYTGSTAGSTNEYFWIGKNTDGTSLSAVTGNGTELVSPLTGKLSSETPAGKEWYNSCFYLSGATESSVAGVYSYLFQFINSTNKWEITQIDWDAEHNYEQHNIVVASLRSRGVYSGQTLVLEVTNGNNVMLTQGTDDMGVNPLGEFTLSVTGATGGPKEFTVTLDTTSTKYISKVLGTDVFDKDNSDFALYVHEVYPHLLKNAYETGVIRGLKMEIETTTEGDNFLGQWDTTISPMVVSEVRGGNVADLFQVITISDGESANFQVKITVQNIDLETGEFDLIVRDFNDTDDVQVVLEKFSRCSMNPDLPGYVAKKVGTSDGEYELRSKYIMLTMVENHPVDAVPSGFKGFACYKPTNSLDGPTYGGVMYKTEYYDAGDVVRYAANGSEIVESGDKVRKVMLGVSSQIGFDKDLLKYKGVEGTDETYGFHLSVNASNISGSTPTSKMFLTTPYDLEGQTGADNKLTSINYRKFTFMVYGGRDGWDIYRRTRTNGDGFIFGKNTYTSGNTVNGGVFNTTNGNSDYYAYLQGIETFANPEAVDINVFATPGIDFYNHSSLVNQAIDMVENERADSLYIMNSPNITGATSAEQVVGLLDDANIDSNYSATYWPWIQVRDTDNATQLYIPPTGEVLKNIALTDNVSYPWFAVAGYSRGLVNSIKASKKLTLDERDDLYKNRINPIATFSDTGTIIWGNKTLQVRESALDRINVRRLLLRARKLISAVSVRLLFEQNDEIVRNEFLRLVNPILESIKKERGLYEFRVTVSNDPEDIDANTLRGKIYIKPTRSLEFIDLEFIITPTGASFENI